MRCEILHIKEYFPALGENGCDATLTTYLPDNLTEMGRNNEIRPCLLICPGRQRLPEFNTGRKRSVIIYGEKAVK